MRVFKCIWYVCNNLQSHKVINVSFTNIQNTNGNFLTWKKKLHRKSTNIQNIFISELKVFHLLKTKVLPDFCEKKKKGNLTIEFLNDQILNNISEPVLRNMARWQEKSQPKTRFFLTVLLRKHSYRNFLGVSLRKHSYKNVPGISKFFYIIWNEIFFYLITWPNLILMVSNFNHMCENNSKLHLYYLNSFSFPVNDISIPEKREHLTWNFWVVSTHTVKICDHLNKIFILLKDPVYVYSFESFSHQHLLMVFHRGLSDSKSPQISRTLLCILVDRNNTVVWMVSTCNSYFQVFHSVHQSFKGCSEHANLPSCSIVVFF